MSSSYKKAQVSANVWSAELYSCRDSGCLELYEVEGLNKNLAVYEIYIYEHQWKNVTKVRKHSQGNLPESRTKTEMKIAKNN